MLINFHLTSKESRAQFNLFSNSISAALSRTNFQYCRGVSVRCEGRKKLSFLIPAKKPKMLCSPGDVADERHDQRSRSEGQNGGCGKDLFSRRRQLPLLLQTTVDDHPKRPSPPKYVVALSFMEITVGGNGNETQKFVSGDVIFIEDAWWGIWYNDDEFNDSSNRVNAADDVGGEEDSSEGTDRGEHDDGVDTSCVHRCSPKRTLKLLC